MILWKCLELHTHTRNSDGTFTLAELCGYARDFLYDGIALTDHNTMSGMDELSSGLAESTVPVIPGIEWTTYFGHMLVIGVEKYVDWRFALPDTIDEYTYAIKEAKGVIGIAHPFNFGSPLCTGCYWDFKVKDWNNVDYIEVWSEPFPQKRLKNELAFAWWTELLNQGHHIAACAGWDWHKLEIGKPVLPAGTWLGLRDGIVNVESVKEAITSGRCIVSSGPFPDIVIHQGGRTLYPGDTLERKRFDIAVTVDENIRRAVWGSFGIHTTRLCLVHNGVSVKSVPWGGSGIWEGRQELSSGWFRLEGYGDLENKTDKLLFFSSPFYIG